MPNEKKKTKENKDDNDSKGCISFTDDLLRNYGIISVFGRFNIEKSEEVVEKLIWASGNSPPNFPISLVINSYGGYLHSVFPIIDIMESIKQSVHTYGIGSCFSAGALLLMSGEKGYRHAFPSTRVMIHHFGSGFYGDYNEFKDIQVEYDSLNDYLIDFISKRTGNTTRIIKRDMKKNKYFVSPKEAVKYGICDKVVEEGILEIIKNNTNELQKGKK